LPEARDPLPVADRSLVRAAIAFDAPSGERIWNRFSSSWRDRLRAAWADALARGTDADAALDALRREHAAGARPDPARVHASWWARALQEESPAVRHAVAASAPESIRRELGLEPGGPNGAGRAIPEAVRYALSLWSERLVGGPPPGVDDTPVVRAMTGLPPRSVARLVGAVALAKWAYATSVEGPPPKAEARRALTGRRRSLLESFRGRWPSPDKRAAQLARLDLDHHVDGKKDDLQKLGLVTLSRLLAVVEPQRTRWVLQHVPYHVAKFMRSRTGLKTPHIAGAELVEWEQSLFDAAWDRLHAEGRLPASPPQGEPH
jgi:hypothetical protein